MLTVMSKSEYLIIRLKGVGKNHAVRICIGITVDEMSISKIGKHYFLVIGNCEIGFPLKIFRLFSDLAKDTLIQEKQEAQ